MYAENPEEIEILKEFGSEGREVLDEAMAFLLTVIEAYERQEPLPIPSIAGFRRRVHGIASSAEFLQVKDVGVLAMALSDRANKIEALGEATSEELEGFSYGIEKLSQFFVLMEQTGHGDGSLPKPEDVLPSDAASSSLQETDATADEAFPGFALLEEVDLNEEFKITITEDMINTFIQEAAEQLEMVEESLLTLERDFANREALNTAFRGIHSFKGNCGLFGFGQLEKLGHDFETILDDFKEGIRPIENRGITALLKTVDVLKTTVAGLPQNDGVVKNHSDYLELLRDYGRPQGGAKTVALETSSLLGEILVETGAADRADVESALSRQAQTLGEILVDMGTVNNIQIDEAINLQNERRHKRESDTGSSRVTAQNIRVDLFKLDMLMNLIGELIISENMVINNPDLENYQFENFRKAALQLTRVSRDLQNVAMSLRMIPIGTIFRRMVRVVRDLSVKQYKSIELVMDGEDTEVDKSIIETMADPLLHLVRNAIDHGIETKEERILAGKKPTGTIKLVAYHQGGEVFIKIEDDGRGINPKKILAKAREKKLVPEGAHLTQNEIFGLIFEPGFSTAGSVTDISGRGVGMDVVRKNIEKIKGKVDVTSKEGHGTVVFLRIPLTLAIIDGMLVRVGDQLITIPILSISESIRLKGPQITASSTSGDFAHIRGQLVPILRLYQEFRIETACTQIEDGILVVVEHRETRVALLVDEIIGQYQTVIKGLSEYLGNVSAVAGTSILSDGDISLILDVAGLVEQVEGNLIS